ncbi:MAG TPA: LemA family protein [bacterium]|nr:LemA family protein [bacterium]
MITGRPDPARTPGAWAVAALLALAVVLGCAGWWITTYNRLVQARAAVDSQWAQVEAQYQRRVDLVPALVAAAAGSLAQERQVFTAIAAARAAYLAAPPGSPDRVRAATALEAPVGRLIGVVEASPDLRSRAAVAALMDELAGTENRIAVERRRYNDRVLAYNTPVQQVPSAWVASAGAFRSRPYFEAEGPAAAPPTVRLPP